LARPALAQGEASHTLRYVPQGDVTILDPLATTAYPTRNHGHMCWDTLYGLDEGLVPRPQLAAGHVVEEDGRRWTVTLRDGPRFHDGEKVLARDAVASVKRWLARDTHGQSLSRRLAEIRALDDHRFEMRLERPFAPMLDALGKVSSYPCFIYPERFAAADPAKPFTEVVGSGPYRFEAGERLSGSRLVYRRFADYVPTPSGAPSFLAGPKLARFERVEWRIIGDATTSTAALRAGEVDWLDAVPPDLDAVVARDRNIRLERLDAGGFYAGLRFNHLHPPFDDVTVRRAMLKAVSQPDFMAAAAGDEKNWRSGIGAFPADTPFANDEGMDALNGARDVGAAKAAIAAAGKAGAKVVALHATDIGYQDALMSVGVDLLKKVGFAVDDAASDWGTLLQRRANRRGLDQGGWSALIVLLSGIDLNTPAGHLLIRGNGDDAWFGWPTAPRLEELREAWFDAPDLAAQKAIARQIQAQLFADVPYLPLGQFFMNSALRRDLVDYRRGFALPLNVQRA
jgi:peptide/nickel transport system substrate-binding protein